MHPRPTPPITLARLEPRLLMYAFTLTDGTLRLEGDATSQSLSVTVVDDKIQATLSEGGQQLTQQQWTTGSVRSITVFCYAGDDFVRLSNRIKVPAILGGFEGNDTLIGGGGHDQLAGGAGNDRFDGGGGGDTFIGGGAGGVDTVDYSARTNRLTVTQDGRADDGETGENDNVSQDVTRILCGAGDDRVTAGAVPTGGNYVHGGEGNDVLLGLAGTDTLVGSGGNDRLDGGDGRDLIYGETGKDTLVGGSGNDTLKGGKGIDQLFGGKGADKLYGRDAQADLLDGGPDADSVLDRDDQDKVVGVP